MTTDAHAHLSFLKPDQVEDLCARSSLQWILGGYDARDWQTQESLRASYPNRFLLSFGIHPWVIADERDEDLEAQWRVLCDQAPRADFMGEMGLDFHVAQSVDAQKLQRHWFERQLILAKGLRKKVVLHVVQAHAIAIEVLDSVERSHKRVGAVGGFVHGFSGSFEIAEEYRKRGFFISIGPQVLRDHFKKIKEALKKIPLDNILVESDSPSGPEHPIYAGESVLLEVAEEIAMIKGLDAKQVIESVEMNIKKMVGESQ